MPKYDGHHSRVEQGVSMKKERPLIVCDNCGNKVAHLYLSRRDGVMIQVCSDCKAQDKLEA